MTEGEPEPSFRVAVLGLGLIGGSVGLAARERLGAEVVGWDPDAEVRARAVERGVVDRAVAAPADFDPGADVVVIAAPVSELSALVGTACAHFAGAVVTDVGSTKAALAAAHPRDPYIGGHPLAGAEVAGVENAALSATQFHPEKSGDAGSQLLTNWLGTLA